MLWVLLALAGLLALVYLALLSKAVQVGDCDPQLQMDKMEMPVLYLDGEHRAQITATVPVLNTGRQQCLFIDVLARVQPEGDALRGLDITCKPVNAQKRREDGYWEAVIIKTGQSLPLEINLLVSSPHEPIVDRLQEVKHLRVEIFYKYYCRRPLVCRRELLTLELAGPLSHPRRGIAAPAPRQKTLGSYLHPLASDQRQVMPIRTWLLRPGDDVVKLIITQVAPIKRPGDIICIAETALAIMQGRLEYVENIHPRLLACRLNALFEANASMSSVYSLEMAFREIGNLRLLWAVAAGVVGKLQGRPGEFYRVAGRAVATIDDCTGTLPPYDKYVVLGPADLDRTVKQIARETGMECAVVDANDLGRVDILASSIPSRAAYIKESLKPNPQGNADEQTPLVLLRAPRE